MPASVAMVAPIAWTCPMNKIVVSLKLQASNFLLSPDRFYPKSCRRFTSSMISGAVRCNAAGSLSADPSPTTGLCQCKQLATGISCDTCRSNSFYLHSDAPHGCVRCFCMGVTPVCSSSNFYREQVSATTVEKAAEITVNYSPVECRSNFFPYTQPWEGVS